MSTGSPRGLVAGLILCCLFAGAAEGQTSDVLGTPSPTLDRRLLLEVYHTQDPLLRATYRVADWSAYPIFALSSPVVGTAGWLNEDIPMQRAAYRALLSETAAFVSVTVLKRIIRRLRPYQRMPSLRGRLNWFDRTLMRHSAYSMPSAHAALSYALATSFVLSYPAWQVAAPLYLWATAVAASRLWVGAHYPSDILAGALVGSAAGLGVHLFRALITPPFLEGGGMPGPIVRVSIPL